MQMDLDNGRCWKAPGESIVTEPSPLGLAVTWWTKLVVLLVSTHKAFLCLLRKVS